MTKVEKARETFYELSFSFIVPLYSFLFSICSLHHCYTLNGIKLSVAHETNITKARLLLIITSRTPR